MAGVGSRLPERFAVAAPAGEAFDGFDLAEAKLVEQLRRVAIAVFGPFPEFAHVGAGEKCAILLRLVLEDGRALAVDFRRAKRYGHFDFVRAPFVPRSAIE